MLKTRKNPIFSMEISVLKTVEIKSFRNFYPFRSCSWSPVCEPSPQSGWNKLCSWPRLKLPCCLHVCARHCSLLPAASGPWHINESGSSTPALCYLHVWALGICRAHLPCSWLLWSTGRADTELFVPILILNSCNLLFTPLCCSLISSEKKPGFS